MMLAAALAIILERAGPEGGNPHSVSTVLALLFLVIFVSGALQALLGLLKLGNLVEIRLPCCKTPINSVLSRYLLFRTE